MKHTTIKNEKLFCLNCGGSHKIKYPIGVYDLRKKIKAFDMLHENCEKTWQEPQANMDESIKERAIWWISNSETGMSSRTMWNCFMGNSNFPINHPYDPDDFSRCYKLLEIIPEWKNELYKLKRLSNEWKNLVENWDQLTAMFEQNVSENWENYKEIGMYEFMDKLINS